MSIVDDILRREGSAFTDHPNDRGGPTKYGITQSAWDSYVARRPDRVGTRLVSGLTEPMAREYYEAEHVTPWAPLQDAELRALLADCSVNHGPGRAVRWLQSALAGADVDGRLGPQTVGLANRTPGAYAAVLRTRFRFYAQIATDQANDPDAVFLRGWINRACEFVR